MEAGKNDQLVYFESPVDTNVEGENIQTFSDVSGTSPRTPDYAVVKTQRGSEAFDAARTESIETIRLMVRYRTDVVTSWRVEWEGQKYNITAVDRSGRRAGELWMTAELVGAT